MKSFYEKIVDINNFIENKTKNIKRKLGLIIKKPEGENFIVFVF